MPPKKHHPQKKNILSENHGFTLLEILITTAVLAMIVPAVMGLFLAGNHFMATAREETSALKLAHNRIEELKGMSLTSIYERGFMGPGLIEGYGEIESHDKYKRVTSVQLKEINVSGEQENVALYEIRVKVYRVGQDAEGEELTVTHKTLYRFR